MSHRRPEIVAIVFARRYAAATRRTVAVVICGFLMSHSCPMARGAEPLIQTLPEDGSWVQFHVNLKIGAQASTPTWILKSVGKKEVAEIPCRWIEMHSKQGERNEVIFKCLIAESEFGKGKNPLANALNVYRKLGEQPVAEVPNLAAADPALALILSGPAEAKPLEMKESVELQDGRVECDVITGKNKSEIGNIRIEIVHRLLQSDKVPFRLAGAKFEIDADVAGNKFAGTAELTLNKVGKDAKSELDSVE